jgi:hypothetical protein
MVSAVGKGAHALTDGLDDVPYSEDMVAVWGGGGANQSVDTMFFPSDDAES